MVTEAISGIIIFFGSLIVGIIILFLAQKAPSTSGKWLIRIIGFLVMFWWFLLGIWNNYIAK
jgi:hypothetical protein